MLTTVSFVFEQLRGRVRRRATESVEDVAGAADCAKTKVTHFNTVGAGVENILSLQVPVDNIVIMLGKRENRRVLKTFIECKCKDT